MADVVFDPMSTAHKLPTRKVTFIDGSSVDPFVINALVKKFWNQQASVEQVFYPQPALLMRNSAKVRLPCIASPVLHGVPCGVLMTTLSGVKAVIIFDVFKPEFNKVSLPQHSTWESLGELFNGTLIMGMRMYMDIKVNDVVTACGKCFVGQESMPYKERLKVLTRIVERFPTSLRPFSVSIIPHAMINNGSDAARAFDALKSSVLAQNGCLNAMRGVQMQHCDTVLAPGPSPSIIKWDPLVVITLQFEVDRWMCSNMGRMQDIGTTDVLTRWKVRVNEHFCPKHHCRAVFQVLHTSTTLRMIQEAKQPVAQGRRKASTTMFVPSTTMSVNEFVRCEVSSLRDIKEAVHRAQHNIVAVDEVIKTKF